MSSLVKFSSEFNETENKARVHPIDENDKLGFTLKL